MTNMTHWLSNRPNQLTWWPIPIKLILYQISRVNLRCQSKHACPKEFMKLIFWTHDKGGRNYLNVLKSKPCSVDWHTQISVQ